MTGHDKLSGSLPVVTTTYEDVQRNILPRLIMVMGLAVLLPVVGCSTTSPSDQNQNPAGGQAQLGEVTPKRTGKYPNFAVMPTGATEQLTVEEASAISGRLASDKSAQGAVPAVKGTDRATLQRKKLELQAERDATLRQIEAN